MMFEGISGIGMVTMLSSLFVAFIVLISGLLKEKVNIFDVKTLWRTYLYLMLFISLAIGLQGGAYLLRAGSSYLVNPQFAYHLEEPDQYIDSDEDVFVIREEVEIEGETYYFNAQARDSDLINGATIFISLFIIFLLHKYFANQLESKDKKNNAIWHRVYIFASVLMYGVLSLVVIPTTTYDIVNYTVKGTSLLGTYDAPLPGAMIAVLIVILPTWLVFLNKMMKFYKKD